ncbi:MAG: VWA domain-containing protein, partial [Nitrospiraceae bacterium]|nr:VWA domain-containing protein [Nitrospiraceae bacterium]
NFDITTHIERLSAAKIASKEFNRNMVSNARVGLVSFGGDSGDSGDGKRIDIYSLTHNISYINEKSDALWAYGGTPTASAIQDAKNDLVNDQRSGARPYIILLSDGEPTIALDGSYGATKATADAISEASIAKNTVINGYDIKIYTIGFGTDASGNATMESIASTGCYYYAATIDQLREIYYDIAQQISDFDITTRQYGVQGFTPYGYDAHDTVSGTLTDTFIINETINDFKVEIDNPDLNFTITSPSGTTYPDPDPAKHGYNNRTGFYLMETGKYVWISPISGEYPQTDMDCIEEGNWTINVTGSGEVNITTYIDKKSAAQIASHAFISSLDPTRLDRVGLATYSYSSTNDTANQTSYICEGNQWEGYFTVDTGGVYYFNLTWDDASDLDLYLYDGITVLNASSTGSNPETVSAALSPSTNYRIVVDGTNVTGNDTQFTIEVFSSPLGGVMCAYHDSNNGNVPRYRHWDGADWSDEASANNVGGTIQWIVMQSCPTRDETIMGTLDSGKDVNVQIWDGSAWGDVRTVSDSLDTYKRRGFDIAYEQISGDAMVVYMDMGIDNGVPRYQIWNGSAWTDGDAVNGTNPGTGDIGWVRLAANPNSDEMVLVTLTGDDDARDIRAQVWDGSSWGNPITITNDARAYSYQCFDAVYDKDGDAMVVWSDRNNSKVQYRVWNGSVWSAVGDIYSFDYDHRVYWIKLASDPNSNNILMGALNRDKDVNVSTWNGSAWSLPLKIEDNTYEHDKRIMDVSFEQLSGRGLVVWGDSTHTPKYRIWNGSWGSECSASNLGGTGYTRWVQLTPDPDSDEIFLMTSDGNKDINIQKWDGSAWSIPTEVETSSSRDYECFDLAYSQSDVSITQTTVNWLEWSAFTDNPLSDSIAGFDPINSSIDNLTADGMTAIDEG